MWILRIFLLQFALSGVYVARHKVIHEEIRTIYVNTDYVVNPVATIFQYNATDQAFNLSATFIRQIPTDVKAGVVPYVFHGNSYQKMPIPQEIAPKVCEVIASNHKGIQEVYNYSNFRGCPFKKNYTYFLNTYVIDNQKIPQQLMIPGRYKLSATIFNKTVTFGKADWYGRVVPDTN